MPTVCENLSFTYAERAKFLDIVVSTDTEEALAVLDSNPNLKKALIELDKEGQEIISVEDLTLDEARDYKVGFLPGSLFRVRSDAKVDAALGLFNHFKDLNYNVAVASGGRSLAYLAESRNGSPGFYEIGVSRPFLE